MTIKPVAVPSSAKRVVTSGSNNNLNNDNEKESQGVPSDQNRDQHGQPPVNRSATSIRNAIDPRGMSPQRRVEVFDELSRHRCSPHKSARPKRRDHHEHTLKRERNEREILSNIVPGGSTKSSSPHNSGCDGSKSPTQGGANSKATESINGPAMKHSCPSPKSPGGVTGAEDNYSGYNSGDEHYHSKENAISLDEWKRRDEEFAKCMAARGYILKPVEEDGACLFRAISLQIYGDEGMHDVIRQHTMDYIYKNREYFGHFVTEDINNYIKRKRRIDSHGNHIEIQAMSEIYSRPVEVYCYEPTPINIFNSEQIANGYAPLRLSYQRGSHYNAILDPYNATVGVGLGLAGYKPELQTREAVRLSEQLEIEQTMFEDKLKTTDWEATNEAIEEQIARESYLQWCRENLQRSRAATTSTIASASATITSSAANSNTETSPIKFFDDNICCSSSVCSTSGTSAALLPTNGQVSMNDSGNVLDVKNDVVTVSASVASVGGVNDKLLAIASKILDDKSSQTQLNDNATTNITDAACIDSDDTDVSSTSSIGNMENVSPTSSSSGRSRKKKTRSSLSCNGKKRRKEQTQIENTVEQKDSTNVRIGLQQEQTSIDQENNNNNCNNNDRIVIASVSCASLTNQSNYMNIIDAEQQPCTSKQLNMLEKRTIKDDQFVSGLPSTSSNANTSIGNSLSPSSVQSQQMQESQSQQQDDKTQPQQPQMSNFYQELLQASFSGYGELSESEMLQQAIQMSTLDYIEDLKRKY